MNIQNHKDKIIINPSSVEDVEAVSHIAELKEYNNIFFDLVDLQRIEENKLYSSCRSMMDGLIISMMAKNIFIAFIDRTGAFQIVQGVINYLNLINA